MWKIAENECGNLDETVTDAVVIDFSIENRMDYRHRKRR